MMHSPLEVHLRKWIGTRYLYGSRIQGVATDCAFPLVILSQRQNCEIDIDLKFSSIRNIAKKLGLRKVANGSKLKDGDLLIGKESKHGIGIGIYCSGLIWTINNSRPYVHTLPLKSFKQKVKVYRQWDGII